MSIGSKQVCLSHSDIFEKAGLLPTKNDLSPMSITDGIYANLIANDVQNIITSLGNMPDIKITKGQIAAKISELLELLKTS